MTDQPDPAPEASLMDKIAKLQQESKIVENGTGEKRALNQGFSGRSTVYFKNNKNSHYHLDSESTKVLIQNCDSCVIKLNARIRTETVEIWRCENTTLTVNAHVKTLQVDLCKNLTIHFTSRAHFDQLIWAGVEDFHLLIGESIDNADRIDTGASLMQQTVPDLKPDFDQFIVRYINGKLTQELIVRLDNGFPTTDREADEFDRIKEKNDKLYEEHVRQLLKTDFVEEKLKDVTKTETEPEPDADATQ